MRGGARRDRRRDSRARRGERASRRALLSALEAAGALPERYAILEVSADLAERQRLRLGAAAAGAARAHRLADTTAGGGFRGVMLANEVADALPCRRFTLQRGGLRELGVALDAAGALREAAAAPDAGLLTEWRRLPRRLTRRCRTATRPSLPARGPLDCKPRGCARVGALLLFDYGLPRRHYYHPQRAAGHTALPFSPPRPR